MTTPMSAPEPSRLTVFLDRPIAGLEDGLGRSVHGLGPGPGGAARPIPLALQLLDPRQLDVAFRPGDAAYRVLSNEQRQDPPPRNLPPIVAFAAPEDPESPGGHFVIARHAHSEGAFTLLHDLLEEGVELEVDELLRLARDLAEVLAYLHAHGVPHGQWNARSVLCRRPGAGDRRFDVINTGIRFRDPSAVPPELIERGCFPPEMLGPADDLPDADALDLEADVFCFAAFLRDVMRRASPFEELTRQAAGVVEKFLRETSRRHGDPARDVVRRKEQEILDHLYTVKVEAEELIRAGLDRRGRRIGATALRDGFVMLEDRAREYERRVLSGDPSEINLFGDALRHYAPYAVELDPPRANSFEPTVVTVRGDDLPPEVIRVTLGEGGDPLEVLEEGADSDGDAVGDGEIRFLVPAGFPAGDHRLLINNRRTDRTLAVESPSWSRVSPGRARRPWAGFGGVTVTVSGRRFPSRLELSLASPALEARWDAVRVERRRTGSGAPGEAAGAAGDALAEEPDAGAPDESVTAEFPADLPIGLYRLLCNELDTGLELQVDEALPDPIVESVRHPARILNHVEQRLEVRGRHFHPDMVIDLGDDAPAGASFEVRTGSTRAGLLTLPAGYSPGEYRLRVNFRETEHVVDVREPRWLSIEPERLDVARGRREPLELVVRGEELPPIDSRSVDAPRYALRSARGREIAGGVEAAREEAPGETHRLILPGSIRRGRSQLFFGDHHTGLGLRIDRRLHPLLRAGAVAAAVALVVWAGFAIAESMRPRIDAVLDADAYNFGGDEVRVLSDDPLDAVVLLDASGERVGRFPMRERTDDEGAGFVFSPTAAAPGTYRIVPIAMLLEGEPAETPITVRSPRFAVEPRSVHRFESLFVRITSAGGYSPARLRSMRLVPVAGGDHDGGDTDVDDGAPRAIDLVSRSGGTVQLNAGDIPPGGEGPYDIALEGVPLGATLTDDGEPATIEVVGPAVAGVSPDPAVIDRGRIRIELDGDRLPERMPIGLLAEDEARGTRVVHRLARSADGSWEGAAAPGAYRLAWIIDTRRHEPIPDLTLEVMPPPEIARVEPESVAPGEPVELVFTGSHLAGATEITLRRAIDDADAPALTIAVDAGLLERDEAGNDVYRSEELIADSGIYTVEPGGVASLEVVEPAGKLLEAYRRDLSGLDRLMESLRRPRTPDTIRLEAADTLFDQGLFVEARELYAGLRPSRARYRETLIARHVDGETSAPFQREEGDAEDDPHVRAAAALGWTRGAAAGVPSGQSVTWDVDFARGITSGDPPAAVAALRESIRKKTAAAVVRELHPFEAAHDGLAAAQLDMAAHELARAAPIEARDRLARELFGEGGAFDRLSAGDRSRAFFLRGHTLLWYAVDENAAREALERGAAIESGGSFATLCAVYLSRARLATADAGVVRERRGDSLPESWERDFLDAYGHHVTVRDTPNFNILAERAASAAFLFPEERTASADVHDVLERLESAQATPDPFAHRAVLHFLRNAQRLSWPRQEGGRRAAEHRERFLALELSEPAATLREALLLESEIAPLDTAQIAVLPRERLNDYRRRLNGLLAGDLPEALRTRIEELARRLERG